MKEQILQVILSALKDLDLELSEQFAQSIAITQPNAEFGDYATNAALVLAQQAKINPKQLAQKLVDRLDKKLFEKVEIAGSGFINFRLKNKFLLESLDKRQTPKGQSKDKILLEYFQPNIAKPLHIGHLRTAVVGDALKRMMLYVGMDVESDTHMGDWGTQFGFLILAKKRGEQNLEEAYVKINAEAEIDPVIRDNAKAEFVKLEQGHAENKNLWKEIVNGSIKKIYEFFQRI
jgi:arginyl-tRNA synthetase